MLSPTIGALSNRASRSEELFEMNFREAAKSFSSVAAEGRPKTIRAMHKKRIVLFTAPADQGDILRDFLEWHLDLGVDLILALDHGSTDGSSELLDEYSRTGRVRWFPLPE